MSSGTSDYFGCRVNGITTGYQDIANMNTNRSYLYVGTVRNLFGYYRISFVCMDGGVGIQSVNGLMDSSDGWTDILTGGLLSGVSSITGIVLWIDSYTLPAGTVVQLMGVDA
jgi:hypothetical protein